MGRPSPYQGSAYGQPRPELNQEYGSAQYGSIQYPPDGSYGPPRSSGYSSTAPVDSPFSFRRFQNPQNETLGPGQNKTHNNPPEPKKSLGTGNPWNEEHEAKVIDWVLKGKHWDFISNELNRKETAIETRWHNYLKTTSAAKGYVYTGPTAKDSRKQGKDKSRGEMKVQKKKPKEKKKEEKKPRSGR